jgi:hypothetical protein
MNSVACWHAQDLLAAHRRDPVLHEIPAERAVAHFVAGDQLEDRPGRRVLRDLGDVMDHVERKLLGRADEARNRGLERHVEIERHLAHAVRGHRRLERRLLRLGDVAAELFREQVRHLGVPRFLLRAQREEEAQVGSCFCWQKRICSAGDSLIAPYSLHVRRLQYIRAASRCSSV